MCIRDRGRGWRAHFHSLKGSVQTDRRALSLSLIHIYYLLPLYNQEGKSQLVLAVGCTGGKHRSVVFAELLAAHIRELSLIHI